MHYFDTSIIVPLIIGEATSVAVNRLFSRLDPAELLTSLWTRVEFASLTARDLRHGVLPESEAGNARARFEKTLKSFEMIVPAARDFNDAYDMLRSHKVGLRGGDALHLAIARSRGVASVHSLDKRMIRAGRMLGLHMTSGGVFGDDD